MTPPLSQGFLSWEFFYNLLYGSQILPILSLSSSVHSLIPDSSCSISSFSLIVSIIPWPLVMTWHRQWYTSIIAFDIAQFFPSLNHKFLSTCLKKAGLNTNVVGFFNSYHSNQSTIYTWNNFLSPAFNTNVGVGQGSALSPILSAIYLAPIIKTFKKKE